MLTSDGNSNAREVRPPVTQAGIHRAILKNHQRGDWNAILCLAARLRPAIANPPVVKAVIDAALSINSPDGVFLAVNLAIYAPASGVERVSYATQFVKRGYHNEGFAIVFSDPQILCHEEVNEILDNFILQVSRSLTKGQPAVVAAQALRRRIISLKQKREQQPDEMEGPQRVLYAPRPALAANKKEPILRGADTIIVCGANANEKLRDDISFGIKEEQKNIMGYKIPEWVEVRDVFLNRYGDIWNEKGAFFRRNSRATTDIRHPISADVKYEKLINCCGMEFNKNPYHWFGDAMPNLAWRFELMDEEIPVAISDTARPWVAESLALASKNTISVVPVGDVVFASSLILPRGNMYSWARSAFTDEFHSRMIERACQLASNVNKRPIYISRRDAVRRTMTNELLLEEELRSRDVLPVTFTGLSLVEKIALVVEAPAIIGPHGAGLAMLLFARPGRLVLEILPLHVGTSRIRLCMANISRIIGHRHYLYLENPEVSPGLGRWNVSIDKFVAVCDSLNIGKMVK